MTCATYIHCWRLPVICALSAALLLPSACGGAEKTAQAPAKRTSAAHERIELLMAQIDDMEHGREVTPLPDLKIARRESVAMPVPAATSPQSDVQPAAARRAASRPTQEQTDMCFANPQDGLDDRCDEVCQLASNICANASSICRLAAQLDGDQWADGRCESAVQSCARADQRCCDCQ